MTSPVDCMPGPTDGSTPRSLAVENAGALTATKAGGSSSPPPQPIPARVSPSEMRTASSTIGTPVTLDRNGHGPRGPRVDLDEVHAVVADDELGVDQAMRAEGQHDALHRRRR